MRPRTPSDAWVTFVFYSAMVVLLTLWVWISGMEKRTKPPLAAPGGDESTITPWN